MRGAEPTASEEPNLFYKPGWVCHIGSFYPRSYVRDPVLQFSMAAEAWYMGRELGTDFTDLVE